MNPLDVVLVVAAVVYALSGYRQGFVLGSASTVGLLAGGFVGVKAAPAILDGFRQDMTTSIAALVIVLFCTFTGQAVGAIAGSRIRTRITWHPARLLDAVSGGALSVLAMLLIAWVLAVAASGARVGALNREIRGSHVLGTVDRALPGGADHVMGAFNALVNSSQFPRYLEPFAQEHITDVPAPPAAVADRPGIRAAAASVVKIIGSAPSCSETLEGTGFAFADDRVMTNAHVVAGVTHPIVSLGGDNYAAQVVYYDSSVDLAVLLVQGLQAPPLHFDGHGVSSGALGAVLGYPENGPYDVQAARVRDEQTLRSPNIYGDDTVYRDTYAIYSHVRQGNSGGPLVDAQGDVIGVIFAASLTDSTTGYALTAHQVAPAATAGATSNDVVSTGPCAAD
jgi:S1-C subfamily serine protease